MPNKHYYVRHITPDTVTDSLQPHSADSNGSSRKSYQSSNGSPSSINTQITTPPRSPSRPNGTILLPKIRTQDQGLDPATDPFHDTRMTSITSTGFPPRYGHQFSHASFNSRSQSPADVDMLTPASAVMVTSATSTTFMPVPSVSLAGDSMSFRRDVTPPSGAKLRPTLLHSRTPSCSSIKSHSRSASGATIDESIISRFGYPTYRQIPTLITSSSNIPKSTALRAVPYIAPKVSQVQAQPQPLAPELLFDNYPETPTSTTLLEYLTAPNPSPSLVKHNLNASRLSDMHYWWDIRNLRAWGDFKLQTIQGIPGFEDLLNSPIPAPALPIPVHSNLNPETVSSLHDLYTDFYAGKINAALKVALGNSHPTMRAHKAQIGARQLPDFVSNYDSDFDCTIHGDGRGRVVGLVKTFDQWNTGMRTQSGSSKIDYLRELAHLHRYLREHSCRYGFIMTEIELVCVRAGTDNVPYFGLLELAPTIQLNKTGRNNLTAGLALWYLHMLARNSPLPGQCGWRLDVGAPAALTRLNHLERDSWMLKPEGKEKRDAKRNRGFVFPDEPLSRRESAKPKRWSRT